MNRSRSIYIDLPLHQRDRDRWGSFVGLENNLFFVDPQVSLINEQIYF